MGLVSTNLGPEDQSIITEMSLKIVHCLRNIPTYIQRDAIPSQIWFGDTSVGWINELGGMLRRMASIINLHPIYISEMRLALRMEKSECGADSLVPLGGFQDFTKNANNRGFITRSQGQVFCIELGNKWRGLPNYRYQYDCNSKFQLLLHELSHLILDTQDICYDIHAAVNLASCEPIEAKKNADNWGYFIEYCKNYFGNIDQPF